MVPKRNVWSPGTARVAAGAAALVILLPASARRVGAIELGADAAAPLQVHGF